MKKLKKEYYISMLLGVLFVILALIVKFNNVLNIDKVIFDFIIGIKSTFATSFFNIMSEVGSTKGCIAVVFVLGIVFFFTKRFYCFKYLFLNVLCSGVFMKIVKNIVRRPRPEWRWIYEDDFSFPSGHTICAVALYGTLILLIARCVKSKFKYPLIVFISIILVLIPFSRIYFGVHYFTDILGSTLFASALIVLSNVFISKDIKNVENKDK